MDESLIEMYDGITNLILAILGSIIIVSICVYYLKEEFNKGELATKLFPTDN
jgi:hypothetical protein